MPNRRDFLKCSAAFGAAALPLSGALAAEAAAGSSSASDNPESYTVHMKHVAKPKSTPRKIVVPDVEGFKVLKGDFHIHTLFSDGLVMPKDRVDEAVDNGLDVISITDHIEHRPFLGGKAFPLKDRTDDHNLSYETALPHAEKQKLLLVRGTEITKSQMPPGHFNALFIKDANAIAAVVDDWRKMLQVAADQGGFLQWNHPGWESTHGGIATAAPLRFTPEHDEAQKKGLMHGIEVFGYGPDCYPIVADWCNERDLAIIANSDIHPSEWNLYGYQNPLRPMTLILAKERTVESVREAFFARRTIGFAGGVLWGRDPWLPALFKAAVEIASPTPGTLRLTNNSSLPCMIRAGGLSLDLGQGDSREIDRSPSVKTLTVLNWMIGTNKPLEIVLET